MTDFLDSGERNDTPSNEYLARENERIAELESQVRELTGESRLREGLRELAEEYEYLGAIMTAQLFANRIRALLSLEGDKKGTQNG